MCHGAVELSCSFLFISVYCSKTLQFLYSDLVRYGSVSAQILCIDLVRYCMQLEIEELRRKVTVRIVVYGDNDSSVWR